MICSFVFFENNFVQQSCSLWHMTFLTFLQFLWIICLMINSYNLKFFFEIWYDHMNDVIHIVFNNVVVKINNDQKCEHKIIFLWNSITYVWAIIWSKTWRSIKLRINFLNFNWNTRTIKFERFSILTSTSKSRLNSNQFELQMKIKKNVNLSNVRIKIKAFCFLIFMYLIFWTWMNKKTMILLSISFKS